MKLAWTFGIVGAVMLHVGVLLFGGIFFLDERPDHGTLQQVELVSADDVADDSAKKKEPEPEAREERQDEVLETEEEPIPDGAELSQNLDLSAAASAPALEAASLGAIEAALGGQSVGGDFADALSFASGGRIGGQGKAGAVEESIESAFSLAEIDQKPRAILQNAPLYPSEMRGKKLEGVVTLIFIVDSEGKVTQPRVEKSTHPAFEKPAVDAVKQWKFEPAIKGGERVGCRMRIPIRFQPS